MAYTFLSLVNKLASEAGVSGSAQSVSTVVGQVGEAKRLVGWVKDAHTEIQNRSQFWRWMRSTWSVSLTVGNDTIAGTSCTDGLTATAVTRFARWLMYDDSGATNVKAYLTSGGVSGEMWMTNIPYDYWRALYRKGSQNNGPVIHCSVDPQNNLVVGPAADGTYTLSGEYMRSALEFAADADVPEMPSRFQDLIWLKALEKYGRFHAAPEALSRAEVEGSRLVRELEMDQLPPITFGEPLA